MKSAELSEHFVQVPDRIYRDPSLKGPKREVLVNVAGHILPSDSYPLKLETVAGETGWSRSTVALAVDELERRRFLVVERRFVQGRQRPSGFGIGPAWWDGEADLGPLTESDHRTHTESDHRTRTESDSQAQQSPTIGHREVHPEVHPFELDSSSSSSSSSSTSRAEPSAATASAVVAPETNGDDDDEKLSERGRDGVEVAEVVGWLQRSDLKAAEIPDAPTYRRFMVGRLDRYGKPIENPWGYLRRCVREQDLDGIVKDFADWTRAEAEAVDRAAREAECEKYASLLDDAWAFMDASWRLLAWPYEDTGRTHLVSQHDFLPPYGRARERSGLSADDLLGLLAQDLADRKAAGIRMRIQGPGWDDPEGWFAEHAPERQPVAQPATEGTPLRPDSAEEGDAQMPADQYEDAESVAAYYAGMGF